MSSLYYTKHTLYTVGKGPDEEYFLVVGQNQYATLVETEDAALPSPPTYFSDGVSAIASIYVRSGSANIVQIQDIRPTIGFRSAGVNASSVHANLIGLNSDDHTQYLLVNGTRAMGGDLSLGGFKLTNASSISSTFTGSLQGTATSASFARNALTASYVRPLKQKVQITGSLVTGGTLGTIDTNQHTLFYNGNVSVDWGNRTLSLSGSTIVDWQNSALYTSGQTSIDWGNRDLVNSSTNTIFNWEAGIIYDANGFQSLDIFNRRAYDSLGNVVLDWENATFAGSITNAVSASYAVTASYALNGGGSSGTDLGKVIAVSQIQYPFSGF